MSEVRLITRKNPSGRAQRVHVLKDWGGPSRRGVFWADALCGKRFEDGRADFKIGTGDSDRYVTCQSCKWRVDRT